MQSDGSTRFLESKLRSRYFEQAFATVLMEHGALILPAYDYSGKSDDKAPKLTALDHARSLVTPDLLIARKGQSFWVEVKYKSSAAWYRVGGHYNTGFSLRLWRHYEMVQEATGIPVRVAFIHERERLISVDTIEALASNAREYTGTEMGHDGMVFFRFDTLTPFTWCSFEHLQSMIPAIAGQQMDLFQERKALRNSA